MNKEIVKRIQGLVKLAQRRLDHDRRTHFGLATKRRGVEHGYCLSQIRSRERHPNQGRQLMATERRSDIESAIDEFTTDQRYRELIRRRLLEEESIKECAEELGIRYQSARRKMMHAMAFLQRRLE